MDNEDIKKIVNSEINKFIKDSLDKEIANVLSKSNSKTRGELINIIKNSLEAVYKMLWQKRDFWKTDIR